MAIFIHLCPYLLITKLKCFQKDIIGYTNVRMAAMRNRESQLIQDLSARACFDRSSVRSETYSLLGLVSLRPSSQWGLGRGFLLGFCFNTIELQYCNFFRYSVILKIEYKPCKNCLYTFIFILPPWCPFRCHLPHCRTMPQ